MRRACKAFLYASTIFMTLGLGGVSWASLIEEWTGNHYTFGNWTDDVNGVVATASGSPQAVANAFGTNTGVNVNGGYFEIPAGAGTSGLSNFTIVVVIRPTAVGPNTGNYYGGNPLAAYDIPGSGQDDVGLSWAGVSVVDGAGQQQAGGNSANGDILETTGYLQLNAVHAVAYQVNGSALTVTTYADGALVASNAAANIWPRSSVNAMYVGGGTFSSSTFPGQIAAIQIYNDATTNAATLTQILLNTYAPSPITLPLATGAAPGQSAPVTIGVPAALVQNGPLTVTLTSGTPSVVASTTVTFAKGVSSVSTNLPILGLGSSTLTATATGASPDSMLVAGLDYSGLVNDWQGDNYTNNSTIGWVDSVGGVIAAGTGQEIGVANVFGTHQGVARNNLYATTGNSGFIVPNDNPPATAPMGLTEYTVAVVFMPISEGPTSDNYYADDIIFGYDIGGAGQNDFGISWGNANGAGAGYGVCDGLGTATANVDSLNWGLAYPLVLNQTHVVAVQVSGTAETHALYVDGLQVVEDTGVPIHAVSTQTIPIVNQSDANIGNAFPGYLAEVQTYSNATINCEALTAILQEKYASHPPITISFPSNMYVDVGNSVTMTVGIPATASASGSFTVALASGNTAVAASTSVTFPKGVTSTNISLPILSAGSALITASGSGLLTVSVTIGGLTPRSIVETFHAYSLTNASQIPGIVTGDQVTQWNGDILGTPAYGQANPPTYNASATLAGTPAVVFVGTNENELDIPAESDITAGLTNFSVVAVVQVGAVGAGGVDDNQWWNDAGIADHELGGTTFDWGLEVDSGGYIEWGTGDPDVETWASNYTVVNPLFHVVVGTYDTLNGIATVTLDDKATIYHSNLFSQPRLPDDIIMGHSHDNANAWLTAQLVELDFYNGALDATERANVISTLKSTYDVVWPDQSLLEITANPPDGEVGSSVDLTVTIPVGINNNSAVPITLTSGTPSVLSFGGNASTNLIFAAGATNVETLSATIIGVGSSLLSVTNPSPTLVSNATTIFGLAAPTAIETFHAYSLTNQVPGIANGAAISVWLGDILQTPANNAGTIAPTFHANATTTGEPTVLFTASNQNYLDIPSDNDPTAGLAQMTVLAVFKDYSVPTGDNGNFYSEAGIADHEIGGVTYDWGLEINGDGEFTWGTGDPDTTIPYPQVVVNDGLYHVVVGTYDTFTGVSSVYVDNGEPVTVTGLESGARIAQDIIIGHSHDNAGAWLGGELAELDFYNGAMTSEEVANAIGSLEKTYGIAGPPPPSYSLEITRSGSELQIAWPTAATTAGYVLQSTTNLLSTWSVSPLTFAADGTNNVATDSVTNAARYYRLHNP